MLSPDPSPQGLHSRRHVLGGLAWGTAATLLGSCSRGTAARSGSGGSGLVIGLTYTPNVQFAPFYMALDRGEYASTVSLRHHGEQEGQFEALLAGTEHLVVAGADEAAVAASNGAELVVVGGYYQRYPGRIIVPESSPVVSLADLAGRVIGVPGRTGETWYTLQLALDTAGLTESDVTIQEIGYTQQAALAAGKVDAIVGFSNNDAVQLADNGTQVRLIDPAPQVPLVGASLVTTASTLEARRTELADAVIASSKGMVLFVEQPDQAVKATESYVTDLVNEAQAASAKKVATATGELVRPDRGTLVGGILPDDVAAMLDFLQAHALLGATAVSASTMCLPLLTA